MRLLVCGGRDYRDERRLYSILDAHRATFATPVLLCCGYDPNNPRFQGADQLAYEWAITRNMAPKPYAAEWAKHGRAAGPIRNQRMLDDFAPERIIAFPGGRGTLDMTNRAQIARVPVVLVARG